jgi:agmatinase
MAKYKPVDSKLSPKFCGVRTFMRLPHKQTADDIDFAVIGVPFDTGATVRVGARFGPEAIRSSSINLKPHNLFLDVSIFEYCSGVDYGDLSVVPGYIEDSIEMIEKSLHPLIDKGVIPILLGGDHSITLPELRALSKKHGPLALIHFDSHPDTGNEYFGRSYTHGTPFRRAVEEKLVDVDHSIQLGLRGQLYDKNGLKASQELGFETITSVEAQDLGISRLIQRIHERVQKSKVLVTFDIDFVDPAYAPGTGTPEVGGFTSAESIRLIRGLDGLSIFGFDVVEVLPAYDPAQITALLAANIAYEYISLIALRKKRTSM